MYFAANLGSYVILFILNFLQGSTVALAAGLATRATGLDFRLALLTVIISDICSDIFYYSLGRSGSGILHTRYARMIGITSQRLGLIEKHYTKHGKSTLFFAKMSDVFALPAVIIAGTIKMQVRDYLAVCIPTSIFKAVLLFSAGYTLSSSLAYTGAQFFKILMSGLLVLVLAIFMFRYFYGRINE